MACVDDCERGQEYIVSKGQCEACHRGFYRDKNPPHQVACEPCPLGRITPTIGATSQEQCTLGNCSAGTYSDVSTMVCIPCPRGSYQGSRWQTGCVPCTGGHTTTTIGSSSALHCLGGCLPGHEPDGDLCVRCARGLYKSTSGLENCTPCSPIYTTETVGATHSGLCNIRACAPGTYHVSSSNECRPCPYGEYQADKWRNVCIPCPGGLVTLDTGSHSKDQCIVDCPIGQQYSSKHGVCESCPQGFYRDKLTLGQVTCLRCRAGMVTSGIAATSADNCTLGACGAGSHWHSASEQCRPCSLGYYQPNKWTEGCLKCRKDTTTERVGSASESDCIYSCPPGREDMNGTCQLCQDGFYKTEEKASKCTPCAVGLRTNITGATSVSRCDKVACPQGSYGTTSNTCSLCPFGYYQDRKWTEWCTSCDPGLVTLGTGSVSSRQCITDCAAGYEYNTTSGICKECPRGFYRDKAVLENVACTLCPRGFVTEGPGATNETMCNFGDCKAGTFWDVAAGNCEPCAVGYYQPDIWQTTCIPCAADKTTWRNGTGREDQCIVTCSRGFGWNGTECVLCQRGTYKSSIGFKECIKCPSGNITEFSGSTSLDQCNMYACAPGHFWNIASQSCDPCGYGQYQPHKWQLACLHCSNGTTTFRNDTISPEDCLLDCPVGEEVTDGKCSYCPRGYYRDKQSNDQSACLPCPVDKITAAEGATSVSDCNIGNCSAGRYINSKNSCSDCPRGRFQSKRWQNTCDPCPKGAYQSLAGQSNCLKCSPGYTTFAEASIATDCIRDCQAGAMYDTSIGDCIPCSIGFYRTKADLPQTKCLRCPAGYITSQSTSTSRENCTIVDCSAGSYRDVTTNTCNGCPIGSYQNRRWETACIPCPERHTTTLVNATQLTDCLLVCPEITCLEGCFYGYLNDRFGCQLCSCNNPCKSVNCLQEESCRVNETTGIGECVFVCPEHDCLNTMVCSAGFKRDSVGCNTCVCYSPCEHKDCEAFETCVEEGVVAACKPIGTEKAGNCPSPDSILGKCLPSDVCAVDTGCGKNTKCCLDGCNAKVCTAPAIQSGCEQEMKAVFIQMGLNPNIYSFPRCTLGSGLWKSVQCNLATGQCWCVNVNTGAIVANTKVRGTPNCSLDHSASVDQLVCEGGGDLYQCNPEICLSLYCTSNPQAVCRLNPCGGCKAEFYNVATNELVDCVAGISDCERQLKTYMEEAAVTSGQTKGAYRRCIDKQLQHIDECNPQPVQAWPDYNNKPSRNAGPSRLLDICFLKQDMGPCNTGVRNWYYNPKTGRCTAFRYGGCDGNGNRFPDEDTCQKYCSYTLTDAPMIKGKLHPTCYSKRWNYKQCISSYCWCVASDGSKRTNTITRGPLECDSEGMIAGSNIVLPVCRDGHTPQICDRACDGTTCSAMPKAECYADPCNGCELAFRDEMGNVITCNGATAITDICSLELDTGDPVDKRHMTRRYYYDATTNKCKKFYFTRRGGNANNFRGKGNCEKTCVKLTNEKVQSCPDGTLLKLDWPTSVCKDQTCRLFEEAVCVPDPCSGEPIFMDDSMENTVDCGRVYTLCERQRLEAEKQASLSQEVTNYIPECDADEAYLPKQCSLSHCWCVNSDGTIIDNTVKPIYQAEAADYCETRDTVKIEFSFFFSVDFSTIRGRQTEFSISIRAYFKVVLNEDSMSLFQEIRISQGSIKVDVTLAKTDNTTVDLPSAMDQLVKTTRSGNMKVSLPSGENITADRNSVVAVPTYQALGQEPPSSPLTTTLPSTTTATTPTTAKAIPMEGDLVKVIIPAAISGVMFFALVIGVIIYCYLRRRRNRKQSSTTTSNSIRDNRGVLHHDVPYFDTPILPMRKSMNEGWHEERFYDNPQQVSS